MGQARGALRYMFCLIQCFSMCRNTIGHPDSGLLLPRQMWKLKLGMLEQESAGEQPDSESGGALKTRAALSAAKNGASGLEARVCFYKDGAKHIKTMLCG